MHRLGSETDDSILKVLELVTVDKESDEEFEAHESQALTDNSRVYSMK